MSLQSAAAGFGAWCEKNNVKFNIPLLGNISIGAKHESVIRTMANTCQRRVDIEYNGRETIFKDETGDVLSFSIIGLYVSGFKAAGIACQIPENMIYRYKDKSYLSNICIEGHMIWIKNINEVKLKPVKNVQYVEVTLEDLGVKIERIGKKDTQKFLEAENKMKRVTKDSQSLRQNSNVYVATLAKQKQILERDIRDLETRIRNLKDKIYEKQNLVKRYEEDYDEILDKYIKVLKVLNNSYEPGWSGFSLEDLINRNKLKKDKFGAYTLVEDSKEKTYYTQEDAVRLENTSHPERGAQIVSKYEYKGSRFSTDYVVAHQYKKKVIHEDEAYKKARDWCNTQDYKYYHRRVKEAHNKLMEIKDKVDKANKDWELEMRSPEYISLCNEYKLNKKDLELKRKELEALLNKLYKKG